MCGVWLGRPAALRQSLQLLLDGRRVLVNEVLEQAVLLAADPLAAFAEAVAPEQGDLVGELFLADAIATDGLVALAQLGVLRREAGFLLRQTCVLLAQLAYSGPR